MRRPVLLLLILILCLIGGVFYLKSNGLDMKWKNPEAWKNLKKGMSRGQVEELLGKPGQIITRGGGSKWFYQDLPREIHKEPPYGYVFFGPKDWPDYSSSTPEEWVVVEWAEPERSSVETEKDTR